MFCHEQQISSGAHRYKATVAYNTQHLKISLGRPGLEHTNRNQEHFGVFGALGVVLELGNFASLGIFSNVFC